MTITTTMRSPLGPITLATDGAALTGVWLAGTPTTQARRGEHEVLRDAVRALGAYFDGAPPPVPRIPAGTPWQRAVWMALCRIPFGETRTYGELARALGRPTAARAVGHALARNPLAILVPCHRVVGADGSLTGFAAGLTRKRWLLAHEARAAAS